MNKILIAIIKLLADILINRSQAEKSKKIEVRNEVIKKLQDLAISGSSVQSDDSLANDIGAGNLFRRDSGKDKE